PVLAVVGVWTCPAKKSPCKTLVVTQRLTTFLHRLSWVPPAVSSSAPPLWPSSTPVTLTASPPPPRKRLDNGWTVLDGVFQSYGIAIGVIKGKNGIGDRSVKSGFDLIPHNITMNRHSAISELCSAFT